MIKGEFYEITPSVGYFFDLTIKPKDKKTSTKFYGISLRSCLKHIATESLRSYEGNLEGYIDKLAEKYNEIETEWDNIIEEKYKNVIRKKW